MKYEEVESLVENIIGNEYQHIQDYQERGFVDTDNEQMKLSKISNELFKKLNEGMPREYQSLLDDYNTALSCELINMCSFYFKMGVRAGTTNLKFLSDIDHVGSYI